MSNPTPGVTRQGTGWKYVIDLPRAPDGKRRQQAVQGFPTRRAARDARDARLAALRATVTATTTVTVADFLTDWLAGRPESDITPATRHTYHKAITQRIIPSLGDVPLAELTPARVRAWSTALASRYAPATASATHVLLAGALRDAVRWGLLAVNPAAAVRAPGRGRSPGRALTLEQTQALITALPDDQSGAVIRLVLLTCLRIGEVLALRWGDVDLDGRELTVTRTQSADARGKRVVREDAKTIAGRRAIVLGDAAVAVVRAQQDRLVFRRARAGPLWEEHDLVFVNARGALLSAELIRKHLRAAATRAGLVPPPLRIHDLRHTGATQMLKAGVDIAVVSTMLGHASPDITYRIYRHVLPGETRAGADALDRLFGAS